MQTNKSLAIVAACLLIAGGCLGVFGAMLWAWFILVPQPTSNAPSAPTLGFVAVVTATSMVVPTQSATPTSPPLLTPTPIPTVTPQPSQTPTLVRPTLAPPTLVAPTPIVVLASYGCPGASGSGYLFDDFGNPQSGWGTHRGADYEIFYEGSEFHFQVFQPNNPVFTWKLLRDLGTRYRLEVQARKMGGPNQNSYGLLFGGQSDATYDYFLINDAGSYQVIKKADGQTYELASWTRTPFVNQGGLNFLGLRVEGTQVTFCVNGSVLTVINDLSLKSGRIGMAAGSFDEPVHIHFDNFGVWKLD